MEATGTPSASVELSATTVGHPVRAYERKHTVKRILTTAATAVGLVTFLVPIAASAQTTGADFGRHVRNCAQTMGFSGAHNPGMHHGFVGWDGERCES